jgi:predicted transcriptional regulator
MIMSPMKERGMNDIVRLPKLLAARLKKVSIDQGIAPAKIAHKAIAEHLQYLEWKERAIASGDADIAAGRLMTTEQVFAAVAKQRATRVGKAKKAA